MCVLYRVATWACQGDSSAAMIGRSCPSNVWNFSSIHESRSALTIDGFGKPLSLCSQRPREVSCGSIST